VNKVHELVFLYLCLVEQFALFNLFKNMGGYYACAFRALTRQKTTGNNRRTTNHKGKLFNKIRKVCPVYIFRIRFSMFL